MSRYHGISLGHFPLNVHGYSFFFPHLSYLPTPRFLYIHFFYGRIAWLWNHCHVSCFVDNVQYSGGVQLPGRTR